MTFSMKKLAAVAGVLAVTTTGMGATVAHAESFKMGQKWELTLDGQPTDAWFAYDGHSRVHGSDACNYFNGTASVANHKMTFNNDQGTTLMACYDQKTTDAFRKAVSGTRDLSQKGSFLVLTDPATGESWYFTPRA